jgi:hypothetical protein
MTDEEIVRAVRSGTHAIVPMPGDGRKFFIGRIGDADVDPDAYVLMLDLYPSKFEGEEIGGIMMGELTTDAAEARAGWRDLDAADDMPF